MENENNESQSHKTVSQNSLKTVSRQSQSHKTVSKQQIVLNKRNKEYKHIYTQYVAR